MTVTGPTNRLTRSWFGLVAAITLASCSTTLEQPQPTVEAHAEDYQEIYKRVSTTATRCFAAKAGLYVSSSVETNVFPDLGYGQVTLSTVGRGTKNYYLSVRIEKEPTGSKLTMISDDTVASRRYRELVTMWATGDQTCPAA
jgi:hypothetical protein